MEQKIMEVNCDVSALEELSGYTIQEVIGCCDASGEGFLLKAYKVVSGVRVYRDFRREDGEYFVSEEYIPESKKSIFRAKKGSS